MKKIEFKIAVFVSFVIHIVLVCALVFSGLIADRADGTNVSVIGVDFVNLDDIVFPSQSLKEIKQVLEEKTIDQSKMSFKIKKKVINKTERQKTKSSIQGTSSSAINNTIGSGGSNETLAKIKAKIFAARRYPRVAQRLKIEGKPGVIFEINNDGSLKYVHLTESCGEEILDTAAIEAVKRSTPLPFYPKSMKLAVKFELE